MTQHATSLSSWARTIKLALDQQGIDSLSLFQQAGLDPKVLNDPNGRYPLPGTTRLWELAIQASGNEALGLIVSRYVQPTTFHALGYSLMASASLKAAFERLARYFRIVTDAGGLEFEAKAQGYCFRMTPQAGEVQPSPAALDAFMAVNLRMCRALAGRDFKPLRVRLQRPEPADRSPYEQLFQAPIAFGADETAMDFARAPMEATLPQANPELARHNDEILLRYLARHGHDNLAEQVRACIVDSLSQGEPAQEQVARQLNMSLRNLQRKLKESGTSYSQILDQCREELARSYLLDASYSVGEITYLLGFSDTSSFSRACKRWTGLSPSTFRQQTLD